MNGNDSKFFPRWNRRGYHSSLFTSTVFFDHSGRNETGLITMEFRMGYSYLLSTETSLANFRQVFNILKDVNVAYCRESNIALQDVLG